MPLIKNEEEQNKIAKLQRLQENVKDTIGTKVQEEILKNVYVGIQILIKYLKIPVLKPI